MLGKYRPKPSFLLEITFLVGVWLLAWLVLDAPLAVIVFVIFAAYALVFLYENWLDNVSRRERSEERRSRRKEGEIFGSYKKPVESSPPGPAAAPSVVPTSGFWLLPSDFCPVSSIPSYLSSRFRIKISASTKRNRSSRSSVRPSIR